jgi:hypothetical protein
VTSVAGRRNVIGNSASAWGGWDSAVNSRMERGFSCDNSKVSLAGGVRPFLRVTVPVMR